MGEQWTGGGEEAAGPSQPGAGGRTKSLVSFSRYKMVDVPQKRHDEESYPRRTGGQMSIWPDLLFPAGQGREEREWGSALHERHGGSRRGPPGHVEPPATSWEPSTRRVAINLANLLSLQLKKSSDSGCGDKPREHRAQDWVTVRWFLHAGAQREACVPGEASGPWDPKNMGADTTLFMAGGGFPFKHVTAFSVFCFLLLQKKKCSPENTTFPSSFFQVLL